VIVLAFNEVESLRLTVNELHDLLDINSTRITISTSKRALPDCQNTAKELEIAYPNVFVYFQKNPFVAAAVLEAVDQVDSKYVVYMSADKETPAELVPQLLATIESSDFDIVAASRWINEGSFTDYGKLKYIISTGAQLLCKLLYSSRLTEFTYGFRIYKRVILKQFNYKESKHPFFLESLLVPLVLGSKTHEIPVRWKPRTEGESVATFRTWVSYLSPIIRIRFTRKNNLLRNYPLR
jgi:glycosyltransferase involved in cell wall biosynthesis